MNCMAMLWVCSDKIRFLFRFLREIEMYTETSARQRLHIWLDEVNLKTFVAVRIGWGVSGVGN
jgi:hypothetical protein